MKDVMNAKYLTEAEEFFYTGKVKSPTLLLL